MSTTEEIFNGLADVLEAGAKKSRQWSMNTNRQQDAEVYETMARKARLVAQGVIEHDVVYDLAGPGQSARRLTCRSEGCKGATIVQQPYMNGRQWEEATEEFRKEHPFVLSRWIG